MGVVKMTATTIFVSPTGSDQAGEPGNRGKPFKTLTKGFAALQNGDKLEISEGFYQVTPGYPSGPTGLPDFAPMKLVGLTNIAVEGKGAVEIYGEGPGDFLLIEDCAYVKISNLRFRGNRPTYRKESVEIPYSGLFSTILLRGSNDSVMIDSCRFESFGNHGISHLYDAKRSYNMTVSNCYFADGGDGGDEVTWEDGAAVSGISSGSKIVNNTIERCFRGIEVEGAYQGAAITNVLIQGNVLRDCYTLGIMLFGTGSSVSDYADIKILNNRIENMRNHPDYPRYSSGIWISGGQGVDITGNTVSGNSSGGGIGMNSGALPVKGVRIFSNVVENVVTQGICATQNENWAFENAVVELNKVMSAGEQGIVLNGQQILCRSNHVENSGWRGEFGGIEMLHAFKGSKNNSILDNRIVNTTNRFTARGVWIKPGAVETYLGGNVFANMPNPGILDEGTNTIVHPKILGISEESNGLQVTVSGHPQKSGRLEESTDLQTWGTLDHVVVPDDGVVRIQRAKSGRISQKFYRFSAD